MKKIVLALFVAVICLTFSVDSFAKEKSIAPEKEAAIEELFDLTMSDALVETWAELFTQLFVQAASVDRTNDEEELIRVIGEVTKEVVVEEFPSLEKEFIPIYDEFFTLEDIEALIAFYKSPAGQKFIDVTPAFTKRSMELGQEWGAGLAPKMEMKLIEKGIDF